MDFLIFAGGFLIGGVVGYFFVRRDFKYPIKRESLTDHLPELPQFIIGYACLALVVYFKSDNFYFKFITSLMFALETSMYIFGKTLLKSLDK